MSFNVAATTSDKRRWIDWLWQTQVGISILSIILSLVVLLAAAIICRARPLTVLQALFEGALRGRGSIVSTLEEMAALILTGLAVLLPYRAGFFNVGGQGQLEIGALAAVVVATSLSGPPVVVIPLALLAAVVVGVVSVLIPLVLRIKRGASEVTTTIMMNFTCINLVSALITGVLKDPKAFYGATRPVPAAYQLPAFPPGSGIHVGVWVAIIVAALVFWWMKRTVFGLELSAVGLNRRAAEAAGISANRVLITAVIAGAAMAGLAGGIEVLGVTYRVAEGWAMSWGFTGVCVAFLGGNALGVVPVAFILSILATGARYMQAMTGVPSALVNIMQGVPVLIFVCLNASIALRRSRQRARSSISAESSKLGEGVKA
ncbi:MAG: ABC transporter permease [Thermoanaerobacteraceae bacterium]|nr:ABC transporter permease [Thermoanaerobacteraceae bacterium]